mmetsp:Transcript_24121/g.59630  ORF Transcript_24121/g.59630 Transcript_24121/m.59630 type:complete len:237 (-) Transcript_24121:150-860(-)
MSSLTRWCVRAATMALPRAVCSRRLAESGQDGNGAWACGRHVHRLPHLLPGGLCGSPARHHQPLSHHIRHLLDRMYRLQHVGLYQVSHGWDLGVGETICVVLVIGFSVDYVVHLGHMYQDSNNHGCKTREERFQFAAEYMGMTVIGGAITTAGSGLIMFTCQMQTFTKMAILISVTILFSLLYSFFFFMGLLIIIGPENETGNLGAMWESCKRACTKRKAKTDDATGKAEDETGLD